MEIYSRQNVPNKGYAAEPDLYQRLDCRQAGGGSHGGLGLWSATA